MMDSPRRSRNRVACRRCQRRKIRCDGNSPSCGSCQKASATCMNDGKQEVCRGYIANMESRMRWLESLVQKYCPNVDLGSAPAGELRVSGEKMQAGAPGNESEVDSGIAQSPHTESRPRIEQESVSHIPPPSSSVAEGPRLVNDEAQQGHEIGLVSLSSGGTPRYIGPSSGYFFASRILSNTGRQKDRHSKAVDMSWPTGLSVALLNTPVSLPPQTESAVELSAKYFQTVHLIYPFLHEPSHMETIKRVYTSQEESPSDIFQVFMVMAVAALHLSRQCKVHLPVEGYYTAAMKHVNHICGDLSLAGLQSLLLLMVYALHNPSCSLNIWNLNYQCLASVVDLGLQRDVQASSSFQISVLEQEMRTRVFWVAYMFDRVICTMMGRPIGLRDEACDLRFPLDVSDSDLINTSEICQVQPQPSPLSHSIHLFKLARMNSEIKYIMHSISRDTPAYAYPPIRDIFAWQRNMMHSLQDWVSRTPHNENSDYDSMEKFCRLKYHETMILLLRPSPGIPVPSDYSLDLCFEQAVDLLRGFGCLYRSGHLLYSRMVVHSILLGTLVMLHCIWKVPETAAKCQVGKLAADFNTSQNILSSIGEYWPDSNRARDCIYELSSITLQRLTSNEPATRSSPAADNIRQLNHVQVTSELNGIHRVHTQYRHDIDEEREGSESYNLHTQHQAEDTGITSDFINMFDDFLQGDLHGSNSLSGIDSLISEVFH